MRIFDRHPAPVRNLTFTADGRLLVVGNTGLAQLWSLRTEGSPQTLASGSGILYAAAANTRTPLVATGGADRIVRLFDLERLPNPVDQLTIAVDQFPAGSAPITTLAWHDETNTLYSGSGFLVNDKQGGEVIAWRPGRNRWPSDPSSVLLPGSRGVWDLAVHPSGNEVAVARVLYVILWEPEADSMTEFGPDPTTLQASNAIPVGGFVHSIAYSFDGERLALASGWNVRIYDRLERRLLFTLDGHQGLVTGLARSPVAPVIASISRDRTVRLWDLVEGRLLTSYTWDLPKLTNVAFSTDGTLLAVAGGKTVIVWDVDADL